MSRDQHDCDGEQRGAGDASGGQVAPGKRTVTEMVPPTYVGRPSDGPLAPGKRTLVESQQARTQASGAAPVRASPAPHASTKATVGHDQTIAPAIPGIDKVGFIDNSEGSFLRTGPRELGGDTVRPERLPAATRVFVSGTHPQASSWWYVTAFLDKQLLRGYVQDLRVNTDLPEPLAELREVQGNDTAEDYAHEKFGAAVTDGHDLRYYENVLLFVNQQRGRAGITGTYQDPGVLGGGANNVQLVAGHRIWLVSAQYAKALQGVVPSGSLTGGAAAKVKRFVGHIEDILRSVSESRHHLDEVAGEYAQAIRDHEATIIGIVGAFIAAEAASAFLAATPTGVGQAAAMVIQLALSGAMMVKHEADANGSDGAQTTPPEADASQAGARLEPHLGKIRPEAARELGRLSRLDQVLLEQLAKRGSAVVEQLGALLAKVPGWPENARLGLVKLAASDSAEAVRLFGKVSQHPHIEGLNDWVLLASRQVKQPSQLLDLEQSLDKAIELGQFHPDVAMEVNHYQGKWVTSDQLRHERAQPGFNKDQHTNIDVETAAERWEMKRVSVVVTERVQVLGQIKNGAAKYSELGVPSLKNGGPKKNIVDVAFGDNLRVPGMDEAGIRAQVERYLIKNPKAKECVDTFLIHATLDGRLHDVVVEVPAP